MGKGKKVKKEAKKQNEDKSENIIKVDANNDYKKTTQTHNEQNRTENTVFCELCIFQP